MMVKKDSSYFSSFDITIEKQIDLESNKQIGAWWENSLFKDLMKCMIVKLRFFEILIWVIEIGAQINSFQS